MTGKVSEIYRLLQELAWEFGDHGFEGNCCDDLSLVEFMALTKAYENNGLTIQDIGYALNFTKSGATRIVDRLETKGYVERQRSSVDGRVCCVEVTDKGIGVVTRANEEHAIDLAQKMNELEPETVDIILGALRTLVNAVQPK